MPARIVFYRLQSKFVNRRQDIPDDARQVVYYSLAVGHHVGVMDCFTSLVSAPEEVYRLWLERLPPGPGRLKLEGALTWGEIEINQSHARLLLPLVEAEPEAWTAVLADSLRLMLQEGAFYLMVRKHV